METTIDQRPIIALSLGAALVLSACAPIADGDATVPPGEATEADAEQNGGTLVSGNGTIPPITGTYDTNANNSPRPQDTAPEPDTTAEALATRAADLAAAPVGACGALIDPWSHTKSEDVMRAWALVLDDSWSGLSPQLATHDDGACPNRSSIWSSSGDCTTADGWTVVGSHVWAASSGGGAYQQFGAWGLTHRDADGSYEALADGKITTYVVPPQASEPVRYGLTFEDYRQGAAHTGAWDDGSNGASIRDGALLTSVMAWPVSGEVYLRILASGSVPLGDLCAAYELAEVQSCALEPAGTFTITGADRVVVTFDGDAACDGCGSLTVNSGSAGTACFGG